MKKITCFIALILLGICVFAQKNKLGIESNGNRNYYSVSFGRLGFSLSIGVDETIKNKKVNYNNPIPNQPFGNLVYLENVKEINLYGSVKGDSASFYRYSIQIEDSQIVNDEIPKVLEYQLSLKTGKVSTFDLGRYNIENKKLTISYYKIGDITRIGTTIIYGKPILPAKFNLISFRMHEGNQYFVGNHEWKDSATFKIDKLTDGMIFGIKNTGLDFIYTASLIDKSTGKVIYQTNNWQYSFFTPGFPWVLIDSKYLNKSGDYEIQVVPSLSTSFRTSKFFKNKLLTYNFTVANKDERTFSQREMTIFGLIIGLLFFPILIAVILIPRRIAEKNLAKQIQQKELIRLQLSSVRSQLNPHFMFNALAGIQNLMNKNKMEDANKYLSKFARLTRNVLDQQELISLAEEKSLLEDYLQMEQFRFGFKFTIKIDETLDLNNIEIPTMLFQPFLENAVKHGIAEKENAGEITVSFNKHNRDLILEVKDNGQGFDYTQNYLGLGLQLSKNRITLLNTIYKATPIVLVITATTKGTNITITLTEWL